MCNVTDERVPPRAFSQPDRVLLRQLWKAVLPSTQQKVIQTLSRLIAQQLPTPPMRKEVGHDRD